MPTHTSKTLAVTMTVDEAAVLLGISRGSAYEAVRQGQIPSIKLGRRVLVPRAKLAELLGEEATLEPARG